MALAWQEFSGAVEACGISTEVPVVVYDSGDGLLAPRFDCGTPGCVTPCGEANPTPPLQNTRVTDTRLRHILALVVTAKTRTP